MSVSALLKFPPALWSELFVVSLSASEFLRTIPITTAERNDLIGQDGMVVFDSDLDQFMAWYNFQWNPFGTNGGTGGTGPTGATGPTGPTGPGGTVITQKVGSGSGNYILTAGVTGVYIDIDPVNLDFTTTIPLGYKLTVTANLCVSIGSTQNVNIALFDGGTGGTLVGTSFVITNTSGAPVVVQGVIAGDGASHSISLQAAHSSASGSTFIYNSNIGLSIVKPYIIYRLELAS